MHSLDRIKPASGCSMNWDHMTGDEKVKHCSQCSKTVHNLSALTKSEAAALLASGGGKLCIAFSLTPNGLLISQPESTFLSRWIIRLRGSITFAAGLFLAGCATSMSHPVATEQSAECHAADGAEASSIPPGYMGDEGNFFVGCPAVPPEKQGTKR